IAASITNEETRNARTTEDSLFPVFLNSSFPCFLCLSVHLIADASPDACDLVASLRLPQFYAHAHDEARRQFFVSLDLHFHGNLTLAFQVGEDHVEALYYLLLRDQVPVLRRRIRLLAEAKRINRVFVLVIDADPEQIGIVRRVRVDRGRG